MSVIIFFTHNTLLKVLKWLVNSSNQAKFGHHSIFVTLFTYFIFDNLSNLAIIYTSNYNN